MAGIDLKEEIQKHIAGSNKPKEELEEIAYTEMCKKLDDLNFDVWDVHLYNDLQDKNYLKEHWTWEMFQRYVQDNNKPTYKEPVRQVIRRRFTDLAYGKNKSWPKATELLVDWIKSNNYIYTIMSDTKREVFIYKDGIYVPEGRSLIEIQLRELLTDHYSQYIFNLVMQKIEPDTFIDSDTFFSTNYVYEIPVLNGVLNIKELTLEPFNPKKIFFSKINANYIPGTMCEDIDNFLKEVLSKPEDIDVFYEMVGFTLLKEYTYEKAFMLHGNGRNGKGKSIELIKRLLGDKNCASLPLRTIVPESFSISELYTKMVNLAGDISSLELKDTSMFKAVTGRDLINGKRKFLNDISFVNYAKLIFACNELPMVYDNSRGFWDRWVLLDYPYTFVDEREYNESKDKTFLKLKDPNILDKITTPEQMSGFLNMALLGLHRLFTNKAFSQTKGTVQIKEEWIRKSNSFMAFCLENIEENLEGFIKKSELRSRYSSFCKNHKLSSKSDLVIKRTLNENYGVSEEKKRANEFEEYQMVWTGVRWK